ncbi:MAG TPA: ATP-binding protein [Candidatus Binatia bacterium]|jgi:anti-sigma regulatory factor (Ser/Thr protein kinase)|nr:ATP-binding protein [Candidatus Binatia bacterium]
MSAPVTVSFKNQLAEIERLGQIVEEFAERHHWSPRTLFEVNVSLEEILTNVISYGYEDNEEHEIILRLSFADGEMTAEIEDDGRPFNPLEVAEPDLDMSLEERPIGGLGIFMVRKFITGLAYRRHEGKNRLTLKKKIAEEE